MPLPNLTSTPVISYVPAREGQYVLGYFPGDEFTIVTLPVVAWEVEDGEAAPILAGMRYCADDYPWICHGSNNFVHVYDEVILTGIDQVVEYENKKRQKRPETKLHPGAAWPDFSGAFPR
jgi:hypothetical protein